VNGIKAALMESLLATPEQIFSMAKSNCRKCQGKGVFERDMGKDTPTHSHLCPCVRKAVEKMAKELDDNDEIIHVPIG
jgi:hypothetical protein